MHNFANAVNYNFTKQKRKKTMKKFIIKPKIIFDNNAVVYLRTLAENRFFIITDPFMVSSGMIKKVTDEIDGKDYKIFDGVVPDPPLEVVAKGIKEMQSYNPQCVIVLGGGSAIDTAKAVIYYSKLKVKFIAIPTTSGTGSEVTSFSVVTDKAKGIKYPLVSDEMLPDIAILDTVFVKSVPPKIVADTGMDVLTHAIESYVSASSNEFSDAYAEKAIVLVNKYLIRSYQNPDDTEAKDKMHKASLMAGLAFNSASLGLNHAIAHNVGGRLKIPHGKINAMLLPHIIEFNSGIYGYTSTEYNPCAEKYAQVARLMGINASNTKMAVRGLVKHIGKLLQTLGIPQSFKECGIDCQNIDFDAIAEGALQDGCINTNPQKATKDDIVRILKSLCEEKKL